MYFIQTRLHKVLLQAILLALLMVFVFRTYEKRRVRLQAESSHVQIDKTVTLQRRLPQCIIIGAMKCGTRALLEYMNLHPDIARANHEIAYFDKYFEEGQEWYREQMPLSAPGQITVEKTPSYCMSETTAKRVRALNASTKVILVVRDPVDRSVSDWIQSCRMFRIANDSRAFTDCESYETSDVLTPSGEVNKKSSLIRRSSYADFIEIWTKLFGSHLLVVDGDLIASDPFSEMKKVEQFLGVQHYLNKQRLVFDEERGFYCMVSDSGTKRCLGKDKGIPHPSLQPDVEAKLRNYFKPLNQRFYRAVGHDFGWS